MVLYSGDLNVAQVHYFDGKRVSGCQMVQIMNGPVRSVQFMGYLSYFGPDFEQHLDNQTTVGPEFKWCLNTNNATKHHSLKGYRLRTELLTNLCGHGVLEYYISYISQADQSG